MKIHLLFVTNTFVQSASYLHQTLFRSNDTCLSIKQLIFYLAPGFSFPFCADFWFYFSSGGAEIVRTLSNIDRP